MLKKYAIGFGVVFVVIGLLGFVPALTPGGLLLGIFAVDGLHNIVHLLSGIVALAAGFSSEQASQLYFKVFGVIYGLVTLLGLFYGQQHLLGIMAHNWADVVLHAIITAAALYLGFGLRSRATVAG